MSMMLIATSALYFLALINPASKICILSAIQPPLTPRELSSVAMRSTLAAFIILIVLMVCGRFLLRDIFRVDIYSLKVAGGSILFLIGLMAVRRGRFFEESPAHSAGDISIVPLAAPMIAGPGMIAGVISFAAEYGLAIGLISVTLALAGNLGLMLFATRIGRTLERFKATGPLIRITGLIVAAVAIQMVLDGLGIWMHLNLHK